MDQDPTLSHESYVRTVREETERFLDAVVDVPGETVVPSCPEWTASDLLWHLGEVQHTWSRVVAEHADGDDLAEPDRPADADLGRWAAQAGTDLVTALAEALPDSPAWSWHRDGGTVAWVGRRMAHEALIHRVDAELAAGREVAPPVVELAVDGVDEVLRVMVHGIPEWGTFTPTEDRVRLVCTNAEASWLAELGRFTGTSPTSGTTYDEEAVEVLAEPGDRQAVVEVSGPAWDLDRWLWGRGDVTGLEVRGDAAVLARFRAAVAAATQ